MSGKMTGTTTPWLLAACTILTVTSQTGFAAAGRTAKEAVILRAEAHPLQDASSDNFTGTVRLERLSTAETGNGLSIGRVHFAPGARTAWHTHPAGQTFIVEEGEGWTQTADGRKETVRAGDVVWCPAGVKHWHGATATSAMTHIAIAGFEDGKSSVWHEKVSDEQYLGGSDEMAALEKEAAALDARFRAIVPIAAFTAKGRLENLKTALNEGLDAGLTINEIKEVLVQLYAYCGFPRSLNGLNTFIAVLDERAEAGQRDISGKEPAPAPEAKSKLERGTEVQTRLIGAPARGAVYDFAPAIDVFLKEHLFADIFGRNNLDYPSREIATVGALAGLGTVNQLRSHLNVCMNLGLTEAQIRGVIAVLALKVGHQEAETAAETFKRVLAGRNAVNKP